MSGLGRLTRRVVISRDLFEDLEECALIAEFELEYRLDGQEDDGPVATEVRAALDRVRATRERLKNARQSHTK